MALRTRGLVESGTDAIDLLTRAIATLKDAATRLEYAKALVDLGSALRRAGQPANARERPAAGMTLAHACGATALLDRAHDELLSAGARSRQPALTDVDSLTQANAGSPRWLPEFGGACSGSIETSVDSSRAACLRSRSLWAEQATRPVVRHFCLVRTSGVDDAARPRRDAEQPGVDSRMQLVKQEPRARAAIADT